VRVLPHNERLLHVLLTLNLGFIIALLAPTLIDWASLPTEIVGVDRGWLKWPLSALALFGAIWSARDFLAWRRWRGIADSPATKGSTTGRVI
jgi:hypothetical protein